MPGYSAVHLAFKFLRRRYRCSFPSSQSRRFGLCLCITQRFKNWIVFLKAHFLTYIRSIIFYGGSGSGSETKLHKKTDNTLIKQYIIGRNKLQGEGSNLHGAVSCSTKLSGRPWSDQYCYQPGSMLYLSCDLHPRDKRACLPKISSPHNFKN